MRPQVILHAPLRSITHTGFGFGILPSLWIVPRPPTCGAKATQWQPFVWEEGYKEYTDEMRRCRHHPPS